MAFCSRALVAEQTRFQARRGCELVKKAIPPAVSPDEGAGQPEAGRKPGAEVRPGGSPAACGIAVDRQGALLTITVSGHWTLDHSLPREAAAARHNLAGDGIASLCLRAEHLGEWDSSLLAFVVDCIRQARERGIEVETALPDELKKLIGLAFAVDRKKGSGRERSQESFLAWLGGRALTLPGRVGDFLSFLGDVTLSLARLVRGRSSMRSKDLFAAMYECGVGSLGIIALTNMLFGLILAFVGAVQLTNFGAQIYVAGLVGIGMLRVMGAVMVGVVMSGRVGAAYAALIGTMQVNEEVDALETMGISPTDFLVLPRMLSLAFMVPLLTVVADFMGMVGGFLVGVSILDLAPAQYIDATVQMVSFQHGLVGLVYATVFGIVIALFGCYHGMRCSRSAQGVGVATTTAVVHSLVGIIISTAIITIICNVLEI